MSIIQQMTTADKKHVRTWYLSGAALVFLILIIGGITRLTGSGLSITEWEPIMGTIPPLNETEWNEAFDKYKQYPEYNQVNRGMTLGDFKVIFFWEYLHRLLGRFLGMVFVVPFAWFLIRKKMDRKNIKRALLLFVLGGAQGLMGWFMVQSGLVDIPDVSHYRLAAHLSIAFLIFGFCMWFAMDLGSRRRIHGSRPRGFFGWGILILALVSIQIVFGAFTAGLNAGHIYNTFPKMYAYWLPPELWISEPLWINFFENMVTIQWVHRVIGTLIGLAAIWLLVRAFMQKVHPKLLFLTLAVLSAVLFQYLIGVFTLVYHVPVWLGVLHQAAAMVLFGVILAYLHYLKPGTAAG